MDVAGTPGWFKSSFCGGAECVEFRRVGDVVELRNSGRPEAGTVQFTRLEWATFLEGVRNGEFEPGE